jgi:Na+-driven multidrug efflux pump
MLVLLLKSWQLYGAAVASITSYLVVMVILLLLLSRKTRKSMKELMIPSVNDVRWLFRGK